MFFKRLREDIDAFMERDPAARGPWEIIFCYPGFHALLFHRLSNWLWRHEWYLLGRFTSHIGRVLTAIEIHPGASIGDRFVIDHGAGVVIGQTAVIGNDVTLYHSVTLGGIAPSVDAASQIGTKRHPTLENDVIVGSGAQVLGPITVGTGARVGANSVVTKDVPPGVTAVGIPAQVVLPKDKRKAQQFQAYGTPSDGCPDPLQQTIDNLRSQVSTLMERVTELEGDAPKKKADTTDTKKAPARRKKSDSAA